MTRITGLAFTVLAIAATPVAAAQATPDRGPSRSGPAFEAGFARGVASGEAEARRGQTFAFVDDIEYRRADFGYRPQFGRPDRYRDDFRCGYEAGYQTGFERVAWRGPGRGNGNGRGRGGPGNRYRGDLAFDRGFSDGFDAGYSDAAHRRRFDPIREGRYWSGDHGYERWYGPRELYKRQYRDAFTRGYDAGYREALRNARRPWWWPF